MGIETNFKFAHKHAGVAAAAAPTDLLGPLRGFVGNQAEKTWTGTGFNMIWRPNHGQSGPADHFLELNLTTETLNFRDITGTGVANRGFNQNDIFLGAVAYLQQISDRTGPQHFEPGVWANAPATTDPTEPTSVIRMGSIPHGTSINLQGVGFQAPAPQIAATTITPFGIGSKDDGQTNLVPFPEQQNVQTATPSRTSPADVPGLDDLHLNNPNLFLTDVLAQQTPISTTVLIITSEVNSTLANVIPPPPAPNAGGGTDSIAFLVGGPPSNSPNAAPATVTAIFWIERVRDNKSGQEFDQLQYTQRVLLNFNGLSWPHVSVATLR
ncbi:MAG TPA: heme-binding protein [Bryobacteraceae bacterium]|nr:heme-binding protein [Bryobacteraceae bacterium]